MPLQQDRGAGRIGGSGLPPAVPHEELPRWVFIVAAVAALALLLSLLRYAVDLLGVVFLIVLVGFAIRSASDWLTEGESVSAWSVAAMSTGLLGTVLVGLWVLAAPDISGTSITDRLPQPALDGMRWLESKGWGERVLLTRPGAIQSGGAFPRATPDAAPPSTPVSETASAPRPQSLPVRTGDPARSRTAEAAPAPRVASPPRRQAAPSPAAARPADATAMTPAPASRPSVPIATATALRSWPVPAVVGKSVRLTATVSAQTPGSPSGVVTFYSDGTRLGSVPVSGVGPGRSEAALVTLALPLGTHQISAEFLGRGDFVGSQSLAITQTVNRK